MGKLLGKHRRLTYVNLIPYNPVGDNDYERSDQASILAFYETLMEVGINCGVRTEHGTDIDAACGQLRSKQIQKERARKKQQKIG